MPPVLLSASEASEATLTTLDAIYKKLYLPHETRMLVERSGPLMSYFMNVPNTTGDSIEWTAGVGPGGNISQTYVDSIKYAQSSDPKRFNTTTKNFYGMVRLNAKAVRASMDNRGAFVRARTLEADSMFRNLGRHIERASWGNGGMALGRVSALSTTTAANDTITLTEAAETQSFWIGQTIENATDDGSTGTSTLKGTPTIEKQIVAIQELDGKLVTNATATLSGSGYGSVLANDYLFNAGDKGLGAMGLSGYLPATVSSGESFFGVDRSTYREALAGFFVNQTADSLEVNINKVATHLVHHQGANPDTLWINPEQWDVLNFNNKFMGQTQPGTELALRWRGFTLPLDTGPVDVVPSPFCPPNRFFITSRSSWERRHLDALPHFIQDDGNIVRRAAGSHTVNTGDFLEIQARAWCQNVCIDASVNGAGAI